MTRAGTRPSAHQLTPEELAALAGGGFTEDLVACLRSAEISKHVLLMEAVRRETARRGGAEPRLVDLALEVLQAAEASRPDVVAGLLALPSLGLWAVECLLRLRSGTTGPDGPVVGHLAGFAAVAALRAGLRSRLRLPVIDGFVHLPTLGRAAVPPGAGAEWAEFRCDREGATLVSGSWEARVAAGSAAAPGWEPSFTVAAEARGLRISLILEDSDPYLSRLAPFPCSMSPSLAGQWQQCLAAAWELLCESHADVARGLAGALTSIIPSGELDAGQPVTATSGWAWGAVLMSPPRDEVTFAEALTHEFHHLVLAAVEDITSLTVTADGGLCYAPWRDDPRPRAALLQGSYAFLGVAAFWLRQSRTGEPSGRHDAEREFARRAENVAEALSELHGWAGLTPEGALFVERMRGQTAGLLSEPVDPVAGAAALRANAEHRARWLRGNRGLAGAGPAGP